MSNNTGHFGKDLIYRKINRDIARKWGYTQYEDDDMDGVPDWQESRFVAEMFSRFPSYKRGYTFEQFVDVMPVPNTNQGPYGCFWKIDSTTGRIDYVIAKAEKVGDLWQIKASENVVDKRVRCEGNDYQPFTYDLPNSVFADCFGGILARKVSNYPTNINVQQWSPGSSIDTWQLVGGRIESANTTIQAVFSALGSSDFQGQLVKEVSIYLISMNDLGEEVTYKRLDMTESKILTIQPNSYYNFYMVMYFKDGISSTLDLLQCLNWHVNIFQGNSIAESKFEPLK